MSVVARPGGSATRQRAAERTRRRRHDWRTVALFLIPATIGLVTFYVVPAIRGVYFSFTDYAVLTPPVWVGFDNVVRMGE